MIAVLQTGKYFHMLRGARGIERQSRSFLADDPFHVGHWLLRPPAQGRERCSSGTELRRPD